MRSLSNRRTNCFRAVGELEHVNLPARGHDCAHRSVTESHDSSDHLLFAGFENPSVLGLGDESPDFFLSNFFTWLLMLPEHREYYFARSIQNPNQGIHDLRKDRHSRSDPDSHALGITQSNLFGN